MAKDQSRHRGRTAMRSSLFSVSALLDWVQTRERGMAPMTDSLPPLDGLTVLEMSSFVAAPLGGMTLAQLGAEVIRIDPVGGGPDLHGWPLPPSGRSLYWAGLNKGKRSVTLNLRDPDGQRLVGDLLAASGPGGGIVLTNAPGRGLLGHASLSERRP